MLVPYRRVLNGLASDLKATHFLKQLWLFRCNHDFEPDAATIICFSIEQKDSFQGPQVLRSSACD